MNVPANPTGFNALSPQQQQVHRAKIGVRSRSYLGQFWRDDNTPDAEQAIELEGWMDVLENCAHSEIRQAWAEYQRTGPRTENGKLYKPDAGALYRIIIKNRPKPQLVRSEPVPETESQAPRVTPERMAEIMDEQGLSTEYVRPKAFPKPQQLPEEERRLINDARQSER